MMKNSKKVLPINENPSVRTCIHHAYPCAIIEAKEIAELFVADYKAGVWNALMNNVTLIEEGDKLHIIANDEEYDSSLVIFRTCGFSDEIVLKVDYVKARDMARYIDIFFFQDDMENEIALKDKTAGFRWNPFAFFIQEEMYNYDTSIYVWMKCIVSGNVVEGYTSVDGQNWQSIDRVLIPDKYDMDRIKLGIHCNLSRSSFREWKMMNFIQMTYNSKDIYKGIRLDYYFAPRKNYDNGFGSYTNFLHTDYETIHDALYVFGNIHEYIHSNIERNYYINICLDEYYLEERWAYKKEHYSHYNLIYGYDDERKVYHILGYGKDNTLIATLLPYEEFDRSGIVMPTILRYKYTTNLVSLFQFNIRSIILGLSDFINNVDSSERTANLLKGEDLIYGIDSIKWIVETEEGKRDIRNDGRISFLLKEYSQIMDERVLFLYEKGYLMDDQYENLSSASKKLLSISNKIMMSMMKCTITGKDSGKLDDYVKDFYLSEKFFVSKLLEALKKYE